ncbi:uncharacterized protein LOC119098667 [Pollicipes pollicipes]|uniref:uncharacterized protein LOC119098667 n=1 Tax=Pollicipes pollicipes TaxID=41117 RepID=UPI0018854D2E|nr:uncharacterized protein LOC119098667 [Pollicipes pollicipes]
MKLLTVLCACALVVHLGVECAASFVDEMVAGPAYRHRRFRTMVQPDRIKLQKALGIKWWRGMMWSVPVSSPWKAAFDGTKRSTFSHTYTIISPEGKGFNGTGLWAQNTACDHIPIWHDGAAVKFHMFADGGIYKQVVLGNPLNYDGAKFVFVIPKLTFYMVESTSDKNYAFISFASVPGWTMESHKDFSLKDMEAKFPAHSAIFKAVATPGKSGSHIHI